MAQTKTRSKSAKSTNGTAQGNSALEKFFIDELKDIFWAEKHLTKALPKMSKAASTQELKSSIDNHLAETEQQVTRLEKIFESLGESARGKKCDGMEGLVKEGESVIEDTEDGSLTRDVAIIVSAQKVEHYEISAYGSLIELAKVLGKDNIVPLLEQTLEEEKKADKILSEVASNNINWEAEMEPEQ
jgi:ferritin-like metal-binding protein YciE